MKAASGPIGGDLSHEFIVLAPTGESEVFYDAAYEEFDWQQSDLDYGDEAGLAGPVRPGQLDLRRDRRDPRRGALGRGRRRPAAAPAAASRSATSSTSATNIPRRWASRCPGRDGTPVTPMMGSYGVGVSRLVGAIIEASHDDAGIVWPEAVAPWRVGLVTMRADDAAERRRRGRALRAASAAPASRRSTTTATSGAGSSSARWT